MLEGKTLPFTYTLARASVRRAAIGINTANILISHYESSKISTFTPLSTSEMSIGTPNWLIIYCMKRAESTVLIIVYSVWFRARDVPMWSVSITQMFFLVVKILYQ